MKRIVLVLAVLIFTAPVLAGVEVTCGQAGSTVTIGYDCSGMEGKLVRAFALDITVDGGTIVGPVNVLTTEYYIYPGSIVINETTGEVTDYGSPVASQADYPDGTLGGVGTNGMTIEMGSLYATNDPVHTTPPPAAGSLLSFDVTGGTVSVAENVRRGGVVMEDLSPADPVFCAGPIGCPCDGDMAEPIGQVDLQDLDAMVTLLVNAGAPFIVPCPDPRCYCGDMAEPTGQVDLQDLDAMVTLLVAAGPPFIVPCQ